MLPDRNYIVSGHGYIDATSSSFSLPSNVRVIVQCSSRVCHLISHRIYFSNSNNLINDPDLQNLIHLEQGGQICVFDGRFPNISRVRNIFFTPGSFLSGVFELPIKVTVNRADGTRDVYNDQNQYNQRVEADLNDPDTDKLLHSKYMPLGNLQDIVRIISADNRGRLSTILVVACTVDESQPLQGHFSRLGPRSCSLRRYVQSGCTGMDEPIQQADFEMPLGVTEPSFISDEERDPNRYLIEHVFSPFQEGGWSLFLHSMWA